MNNGEDERSNATGFIGEDENVAHEESQAVRSNSDAASSSSALLANLHSDEESESRAKPTRFYKRIFSLRTNAAVISLLFHGVLALILASIILTTKVGTYGLLVSGGFTPEMGELDFTDEVGASFTADSSLTDLQTAESIVDTELAAEIADQSETSVAIETLTSDEEGAPLATEAPDGIAAESGQGGAPLFSRAVGSASGRAERKRGAQGRQGDVTKESEDAVERGLDWLARHQYPDGSWSFDLTEETSTGQKCGCQGCSNSTGTSGGSAYRQPLFPSRMAATSIALLPFLGSGYTHTETNRYQKLVASGLRYLSYNAVRKEDGVDFRAGFTGDGAAYIQALATLVCCEAYEMTKDPNLRSLAEGGLLFIERSQLNDGGWRYRSIGDDAFHATESGDVSVLGWQLMALKSGASAGFTLPASVAYRSGNFLDLCMDKGGKTYRYQPRTKEAESKKWGTTAVGFLSREYLGWEPGTPDLDACAKQVVKWIDDVDAIWRQVKKGSQRGRVGGRAVKYFQDDRLIFNLYFAYYGTLALRHYGGEKWKDSFAKTRTLLIETQSRNASLLGSCESGSWLFYDQYMNDGGRVLNTAIAVLILETPYRYLPMYRN